MDVRADTRIAISLLLHRLYEDSRSDREYGIFTEKCENFFKYTDYFPSSLYSARLSLIKFTNEKIIAFIKFYSDLLSDNSVESKLEALIVIATLMEVNFVTI